MANEPIPQPPTQYYGVLGNLPDVDPTFFMKSIWRMEKLYGPIFQLDFIARKIVVLSSYELIKEALDDEKFEKLVVGALEELRAVVGDGLFTAFPHEPNWHKAHRTLMPVFGPMGVRKMFPEQLDIASQMILRWDRLGPDNEIDTADDFTISFDTIGICAFNYRFNDFYAEKMHPFAEQMADALVESGKRATRTRIERSLRLWSAGKFQENINAMHKLCDDLVSDRKANPKPEVNDLLNTMLNVADPVTGEKLSSENIRYQMVTFLVAGHETTSGTLAYLFYNLLKNPNTLLKAQQEVDQVLGDGPIEVKHMSQLKYIDACIKETLRMNGPIAAFARHCKYSTTIGEKYKIEPSMPLLINLNGLHKDPAVWGEDSELFRPERMLNFDKIPLDAWKPFGTGPRSCIGRVFAEQEMILNVALILQRFQVEMADPLYELTMKSTLTTKPEGFSIKVRRRPGKDSLVGLPGAKPAKTVKTANTTQNKGGIHGQKSKMTILYGSNAGTCKAFAEDLQTNAPEFGFEAEVTTMDSATENLPSDQPVVIITSSYEGKPPDNAKKFMSWLESNSSRNSIKYAVFGVGNSEWTQTYHRVPKQIDNLLSKQGGKKICNSAYADVKQDCTGDWEDWSEMFWKTLQESGQAGTSEQRSELKATVARTDMPSTLGGQEMSWGIVKETKELAGTEVGPEKRHLEVQLPENITYQTGDYLVVLPYNPPQTVGRVLSAFQLHADDLINVSGTRKAFLQSQEPRSAFDFFSQRVELNTPATQRQLETMISVTTDSSEKTALQNLASDSNFRAEILDRNYSVLDLLEDHRSCTLTLSAYIDMLKPLTPRQYSISSSPLAPEQHDPATNTTSASITYDVHVCPARSGGSRTFRGVATSYLAGLHPRNRIHCFVRRTNANFHLPADPSVPIIMVAAGTGLAPMRGFVQERAALAAAGTKALGPALLYFGCRDYELDYIYRDELAAWEAQGAVTVRPAFSKRGPGGKGKTWRYTHERIWDERKELAGLFRDGAKIFVCGSASKLAKSTAEVLKRIWKEYHEGASDEEAEAWLMEQKEDRYVTDVFD